MNAEHYMTGVHTALWQAEGGWSQPSISDPGRLHTHMDNHVRKKPGIKGGCGQMLSADVVGLLYKDMQALKQDTGPDEDPVSSPCRLSRFPLKES